MSVRESQFIAWATEGMAGRIPVGPGDDAAVLPDGSVVAVDAVVQGVHFDAQASPADIALKALARPISDLCAMGAIPEQVFAAAIVPPGAPAEALARGLARAAQHFGVVLAGGDTTTGPPGGLALAITAIGRCPPGSRPWLRGGGRADDRLALTGPLGGAGAGRHLRPTPRTDVVAQLRAQHADVHACIDISDGLARNLRLLCAASGTGARLIARDIPVHADVGAGRDGLRAALFDGEDFELLLALPPEGPVAPGLRLIGTLTADAALCLLHDGRQEPLPDGGYEHAF